MDHFVKLDRLPDGFTFPTDLEHRFHFDAERRLLSYRGYMSKADFDRVCERTKDWPFRRVLEDLFRQCVPEEAPRPSAMPRLFSVFARRVSPG